MEENIIKAIATQGIFALLFSYLLFYVLKETSTRESNYQNILLQLTSMLPSIKEDIEQIKEKLTTIGK